MSKEEQARKGLEDTKTSLTAEKQDLFSQLQREQDVAAEAEETAQRLKQQKATLEEQLLDLEARVDEEVENNANISSLKRKLEAELEQTKEMLKDMEDHLTMVGYAHCTPRPNITCNTCAYVL